MDITSKLIVLFIVSSIKLVDCTRVIADERFNEECLFHHNKYRDLHEGTDRLRLNRSAVEFAVTRVRKIANIADNSGRPSYVDTRVVYGENFYWFYDHQGYHPCEDAVKLWYNGIDHYNYNKPGFGEHSGGFSQLVWRSTQSMGCARVEDDKNANYPQTYIVCNYWPPGNVDRQYPYNVLPLKSRPSNGNSGSQAGNNWGGVGGSGNDWTSGQGQGGQSGGQGGHRPGASGGQRPDNQRPQGGNRPGGDWNGAGGQHQGSNDGYWGSGSQQQGNRPGMGDGYPNNRPPQPPKYP